MPYHRDPHRRLQRHRLASLLLLGAIASAAGCDGRQVAADAGHDAASPDLAQLADLNVADQLEAKDLPAPAPDYRGLRVFYTLQAKSGEARRPYLINADGSGKQLHPRLPAQLEQQSVSFVDIEPSHLGRPRRLGSSVRLPDGRGTLSTYCGLSLGLPCAIYHLAADGDVRRLDDPVVEHSVRYFVVNRSGTLIAVGAGPHVDLLRIDGGVWPQTGKRRCRIFDNQLGLLVRVMVFSATRLYLLGIANGALRLFRGPLDCSEAATELPLPTISGASPKLTTTPRVAEDGHSLVFAVTATKAGGGGGAESLVLHVDDRLAKVTTAGTFHSEWLPLLFPFKNHWRVALSPSGKQLAYLVADKIYLRSLNPLSAAEVLTLDQLWPPAPYFGPGVFFSLHWLTEDLLLIDAIRLGEVSSHLAFVYSRSKGELVEAPSGPVGSPLVVGFGLPKRTWVSPKGRYLCYRTRLLSPPSPEKLLCRDRQSGALVDPGGPEFSEVELVLRGSRAVFLPTAWGGAGCTGALWTFDSEAPKASAKSSGGCLPFKRLFVADDGQAAVVARLAGLAFYDLSAVPSTPSLIETSGEHCDYSQVLIAPDRQHLVYTTSEGPTCDQVVLKSQRVGATTPARVLDRGHAIELRLVYATP